MLRLIQRHTIAAAASVCMLSAGLYIPVRQGLLQNIAPAHTPLRSATLLAFALTFILFIPAAILFDTLANRRMIHTALPPLILAIFFTAFWLAVDVTRGSFLASYILPYLLLGLIVGVAFCAYWIPLRQLRRRIPH